MLPFFEINSPAVIPSALGPLQALIAILPHLIVILTTALVALFKPKSYRALVRYFWAHKILALICISLGASIVYLVFFGSLFSGKASQEKIGSPWIAFRGGPERTGAVPGARGPLENARVNWNYSRSSPGKIQAIDSSPTVIGNRLYFGTSIQTPFTKSGTIVCLDTDTGAEVWKFSGEGMYRPLQPVFASPAVGGDGARYLVSGEGYHVEDDSRIFCLDLARVRASGGKEPPTFKWSVQVTNHVESSPAIFENNVYAGTGDDGWWCIDLESGRVKWHLEGCNHYVIQAGPQVDALAKLAGKTVAISGSPKRVRPKKEDYDFSIMLLDATAVTEVPSGTTFVPDPAQSTPGKEMRTVIGKVVVSDAPIYPELNCSRVKIEMEKFYPDAECDPLAIRVEGQPRLFCGSGIEGQAVICIDAENGKEIWRVKTRDPVFGAPSVVNGQVFVGMSNGTFAGSHANPSGGVLALAAKDGSLLWEYKTSDGVIGAVAVKDNMAYACSLDGNLYILNIKDGKLIKKFDTGAKLFCSPTVTEKGIFLNTNRGKVFGLKRDPVSFQWSLNITQGKSIFSSPSVAENRLFVGSAENGLFCLSDDGATTATRRMNSRWSGPGGNAEHNNIADDRGPPGIDGNKSDRLISDSKFANSAQAGPQAACGNALYFAARRTDGKTVLSCLETSKRSDVWQCEIAGPLLAIAANETHVYTLTGAADSSGNIVLLAIEAATGKRIGEPRALPGVDHPFLCLTKDQLLFKSSKTMLSAAPLSKLSDDSKTEIGEIIGVPVLKHNLIFVAVSTPAPQLLCLDDLSRTKLWSVDLPARPIGGPSIAGENVFIALVGPSGSDARIVCGSLTSGISLWESVVEKAPTSPLACSNEHLAYTTADGSVIVLETKKGEQTHTVVLGKGGQAPTIFQDTLLLAADNRVGAFDLATSSWSWGFRDQKTIGHVWTAPLLAGETVWVSTEKQGVIAIGGKDEKK